MDIQTHKLAPYRVSPSKPVIVEHLLPVEEHVYIMMCVQTAIRDTIQMDLIVEVLYGPRREKTCLRGFRQSEFQTSLLSYRD